MQPQTVAILSGLALGAYLGYAFSARVATYPPYAQLLAVIRPTTVAAPVNPSLGNQLSAAVGGALGGIAQTGISDALSGLESWFGGSAGGGAGSIDDGGGDL